MKIRQKIWPTESKKISSTASDLQDIAPDMKYLIVGLGNVGNEYTLTRHNIGFEAVDYIARQAGVNFEADRYAHTCSFRYKGKTIILVKPTTYMNLSGKAVRYHLEKAHIPLDHLLVIADDKDIALGDFKLKPKGSGGSHNGINNIIDTIGDINFPRLRIGIGNNFAKGYQIDFVLGRFETDEIDSLKPVLALMPDIVKSFAAMGIERTMNAYNNKLKKTSPQTQNNNKG